MKITLNTKKSMRAKRVRAKIRGTEARPRLSVFRSNKACYAQLIDDARGVTVAAASAKDLDKKKRTKTEEAAAVGELIAKRSLEKGVKAVAFDRGSYLYHGRVKAVAEAARKAGLEF